MRPVFLWFICHNEFVSYWFLIVVLGYLRSYANLKYNCNPANVVGDIQLSESPFYQASYYYWYYADFTGAITAGFTKW